METADAADATLRECLDGSRTLLHELQKSSNGVAPEELLAVQDLLECIDRNAEQIALALATSRRRKTTDALGAVASLLREQDQYFQQVCSRVCYVLHVTCCIGVRRWKRASESPTECCRSMRACKNARTCVQ